MSSFRIKLIRCDSTVLTLRPRRAAISFVVCPSAMRCKISRSREVSGSVVLVGEQAVLGWGPAPPRPSGGLGAFKMRQGDTRAGHIRCVLVAHAGALLAIGRPPDHAHPRLLQEDT